MAENQAVSSCNLVDIEIMEEDHTWDNQMTVSKGNPLDRNIGAKQSEADFNMGWVEWA